jgi:hypothetical protein
MPACLITAAACEVGCVLTMSRKIQDKKQLIQKSIITKPTTVKPTTISHTTVKPTTVKPTTVKPLRTAPFESGFHFYTAIGNYTGITATNLSEFATKLKTIPIESVIFHFRRKDFQKWIEYTVDDAALAERIGRIKGEQSAEGLRKEILKNVEAVLLHG